MSAALHFTITGEAIVDLAREQVMQKQYDKALKSFTDSLHGMTTDIAVDILAGRSTLTGVNDDIQLEEDDITGTPYEDQLDFLFRDVVVINGTNYKPYGYVDRFNEDDREYAYDNFSRSEELIDRARYYCDNKDTDKVFFLKIDVNGQDRERCVLFKEVVVPFWYEVSNEDIAAKVRRNKYLDDYGHWTDEQNRAEEIRTEVQQQNWAYFGGETYEFDFGRGVGVRQVPIGPLKQWALRRTAYKFKKEWKPIAQSGLKMMMDDPSHTDWMIGAGIDLSFYNEADFRSKQYELMSEIQEIYMKLKSTVLLSGADAVGNVVFPEPNAPVNPDQIAIIPHAGVEYMNAFLTAAAVITEAGGAMSHLSVNGLEYNKQLIRVEGARRKFTEGAAICIQNGTIEVMIS